MIIWPKCLDDVPHEGKPNSKSIASSKGESTLVGAAEIALSEDIYEERSEKKKNNKY